MVWRLQLQSAIAVVSLLSLQVGFLIAQDKPDDGILRGHQGSVFMGKFTPSGERAITVSSDQTARCWDLNTGQEIQRFQAHTGPVYALAISGDGRTLVTGAQDNTLRLWDVPQAGPVLSLTGHQGPAAGLAVSPDGRFVVSGAADQSVRLWNLNEVGKSIAAKKTERTAGSDYLLRTGHRGVVTAAAWRADGAFFATADADGRILIRSPYLDASQGEIGVHAGGVTGLAFPSNNQQLISTGADGVIRLWQLPIAAQRNLAGVTAVVADVAIPTNQPTAVVGATDGTIRLFDIGSGNVSREFSKSERPVTTVAVQPNNSLVAVGDDGGQVRIFNLGNGAERGKLPAHNNVVSQVAFHPDNQRFATAGIDGSVNLWTIDSVVNPKEGAAPQPERSWDGLSGGAMAVGFSSNGTQLFGGGKDGKIRQWKSADDGALERLLEGHSQEITELAVSPNGQQLLSASADKTLRVWNLNDGSLVHTLEHPAAVRSVSVRPDSLRAATVGDDGQVRVWDLTTGILLQSFESHAKAGSAVRWLSDGVTLVSGGSDNALATVKTSIIRAIAAHEQTITDMAMYAGGGQVVTCSPDGQVVMTDVNNGTVVRKFEGQSGEVKCVAARGDNQRLAAGTADGKVLIWNAGNAQLLQTIEIGSPITRLAYSPDNQKLAAVDEANRLRIFGPVVPPMQPTPGVELYLHQQVESKQPLTRIEFSRDSRSVWATQQDGQVGEWAYASPAPLRQFNHGGPVFGVAISHDGKTVVSCSADQTVRIWDGTNGQQRAQLSGHTGQVLAVALSPDESLIVSSGSDRTLRLWDATGGKPLKQLATLDETAYAVAFHPNGQTVAAGGADRTIRLFNVLAGTEQRVLTGHSDYVHSVCFNANGTKLLSYSYQGELRAWNTADGQLTMKQETGRVGNYVCYSPDNARALLCNGDDTARVIDLPTEAR